MADPAPRGSLLAGQGGNKWLSERRRSAAALLVAAGAAQRSSRGTLLQRYVFGTAPGPGVSIFIAAAALVVVMVWRPGHIDSSFGPVPRALLSLTTVVVAWICVAVSFAVAFQADNLVEGRRPWSSRGGPPPSGWTTCTSRCR